MGERQRHRGILLGYANILTKNIVHLLYTPMLLSFVGQGDYGVFQSANSLVLSLTLLSFGFSSAYVRFYTQRFVAGDIQGIRELNGVYLLFYLIICALVVCMGLMFAANSNVFFSQRFMPNEIVLAQRLMRIMSLNVAISLFSTVFDAFIIVHEEFAFQQTRQMIATIAAPVLAYLLLNCGRGAVGVAHAQLAISAWLLALNMRFTISHLGMRFVFNGMDFKTIKEIAAFSAWIFMNQICDLVNQNLPNVILGSQVGANVVAVFAVAVQIRTVFVSLSTTLSNVFVPHVNKLVVDYESDGILTAILVRVGRYQMMLLSWVFGGFLVLGRYFITVWAGKAFINAYWMLLIMIPPLLVPLSQNIGIEIQKAKNMHHSRSVVYLIMAGVNVAITYYASPVLGYWAASAGYTVSIVFGSCVFMNWYYQAKVHLDMLRYWRQILPIVLVTTYSIGVCMLGTYLHPVDSWLSFFAWGALYTAVFASLTIVMLLDERERESLCGIMKRLNWKDRR